VHHKAATIMLPYKSGSRNLRTDFDCRTLILAKMQQTPILLSIIQGGQIHFNSRGSDPLEFLLEFDEFKWI
jgi:hypothetical protein